MDIPVQQTLTYLERARKGGARLIPPEWQLKGNQELHMARARLSVNR